MIHKNRVGLLFVVAVTAIFVVGCLDNNEPPNALKIATNSLPDGVEEVTYNATLEATKGTPPYAWNVTGALPPGLSLSDDTISGTPTAEEKYTFTVVVTDSKLETAKRRFTVNIFTAGMFIIATNLLPDAMAEISYSTTLSAAGGTAPYKWSLSEGSDLPDGLDLDTNGTVSGTPTTDGDYDFTVRVTDAGVDTTTKELSIKVLPADIDPPKITSGPTVAWIADTAATIVWTTNEESNSIVEYGLDINYGETETDDANVLEHSITLTGLTLETKYYFRVGSTDIVGNGPKYSENKTFTTEKEPDTTPPVTTATPQDGTYSSAVYVKLTADELATIYYTINGLTPGTGSTTYNSPIHIERNTVLKFFGVDNAGNKEDVQTQRYAITGDIPGVMTLYARTGKTDGGCPVRNPQYGRVGTYHWYMKFDLSFLPSSAVIKKVTLHLFFGKAAKDTLYFNSLEIDPDSTTNGSRIRNDIKDGTRYLSLKPLDYQNIEAILDLGSHAASDMEEDIGQEWFGFGITGTHC
jgi:hypothetical protein